MMHAGPLSRVRAIIYPLGSDHTIAHTLVAMKTITIEYLLQEIYTCLTKRSSEPWAFVVSRLLSCTSQILLVVVIYLSPSATRPFKLLPVLLQSPTSPVLNICSTRLHRYLIQQLPELVLH